MSNITASGLFLKSPVKNRQKGSVGGRNLHYQSKHGMCKVAKIGLG